MDVKFLLVVMKKIGNNGRARMSDNVANNGATINKTLGNYFNGRK